jgi:4-amino-4-deoxy-L-arabinose transferase-like glycosyltransferase
MSRRHATLIVGLAAVLPRLAVLLYERGSILSAFTEKSDDFAQRFVQTGTFGLVPGEPSAWTQPLYGFFLIPIYWIFGRDWWSVGFAQILVALATALVVLEIGRRYLSLQAGVIAAVVATLNPYLIWHDVHLNREILDQLLAAGIVLLTLMAAERRSWRVAAALGVVLGLSILSNSRLLLLPLVIAGFLLVLRRDWAAAGAVLGICVLTLLPWTTRNEVQVGCFTITTDARALWKANNLNTYSTLAAGKWIDDVPRIPGAPYTPEEAETLYFRDHKLIHPDECAQSAYYRHLVFQFWRDHPGEKAKLAGQAVRMLWDPRAIRTEGREGKSGFVDKARTWVQPLYEIPLYVLAVAGLFLVPRRFAALILLLLAYQTLAAIGFAGVTRYRVPWDFTLALCAAPVLLALARRLPRLTARVA